MLLSEIARLHDGRYSFLGQNRYCVYVYRAPANCKSSQVALVIEKTSNLKEPNPSDIMHYIAAS